MLFSSHHPFVSQSL